MKAFKNAFTKPKTNTSDNSDNEISNHNNSISDRIKGSVREIEAKINSFVNPEGESDVKYTYDEFTSYDQKRTIADTLKKQILGSKLRVFLLTPLFIVSVWFDILPMLFPKVFPYLLQSSRNIFFIINFVVLAAVLVIDFKIIISGFVGLSHKGSPDCCASSVIYAIVLLHTLLVFTEPYVFPSSDLFVPLAVFSQLISRLNTVKIYNRLYINFAFVSKDEEKFTGRIIDYPILRREINRSFFGESVVAGTARTAFISDFFKNSLSSNPCEKSSKRLSAAVIICAMLIIVTLAIVHTNEELIDEILTVLVCTICLCMPIYGSCVSNSMLYSKARKMRSAKAMLCGYTAAAQMGAVNSVILDARELYPQNKVRIVGMKTFSGERIDQVLSDSAALVLKANWPLAPAFEQIIGSKYGILPKVESLTIAAEHGLTGWVKGRRVIIGSAELIKSYGIVPPSKDYEDRYIKDGQSVIYLASAGELAAMFVVSYEADRSIGKKLRFLADNGVSLLVRTSDPNVTLKLMSKGFGIPVSSLKLISEEAGEEYESKRRRTTENESALTAGTNGTDFLLDSVIYSKQLISSMSLVRVLQMIAVLMGIGIAAFLAYYGGIAQIGPLQVAAYQLFWGILIGIASTHSII